MPSPTRAATGGLLPRLALLLSLAVPAAATLAATGPLDGARQVVVVTSEGWDASRGRLQAFERGDDGWQPHGDAFEVALGRSGSAWGVGLHPAPAGDGPRKREGDGRSPAGVFAIGEAFG
jgi:Uncharacterized protein conserved in bacteria